MADNLVAVACWRVMTFETGSAYSKRLNTHHASSGFKQHPDRANQVC